MTIDRSTISHGCARLQDARAQSGWETIPSSSPLSQSALELVVVAVLAIASMHGYDTERVGNPSLIVTIVTISTRNRCNCCSRHCQYARLQRHPSTERVGNPSSSQLPQSALLQLLFSSFPMCTAAKISKRRQSTKRAGNHSIVVTIVTISTRNCCNCCSRHCQYARLPGTQAQAKHRAGEKPFHHRDNCHNQH